MREIGKQAGEVMKMEILPYEQPLEPTDVWAEEEPCLERWRDPDRQ